MSVCLSIFLAKKANASRINAERIYRWVHMHAPYYKGLQMDEAKLTSPGNSHCSWMLQEERGRDAGASVLSRSMDRNTYMPIAT